MTADPRVQELEELIADGVTLPMPIARILELEDAGYVVDLDTGTTLRNVTVQPTASAQAIAYLLADVAGELVI